jgi:hypothetical protein
MYRKDFYSMWTKFTGVRCAACCETHANFADESACLTAYNVRNEVRITTSQITGSVENSAISTRRYFSQLIVSLKNTGTTILLEFTAHQTSTFTGWLQQWRCRFCTNLWHSSLFSETLGMCSSLASTASNFFSVCSRRL